MESVMFPEIEPGYIGAVVVRLGLKRDLNLRLFTPWYNLVGSESTVVEHFFIFGRPVMPTVEHPGPDWEIYESVPSGGIEIINFNWYLEHGNTVVVLRVSDPVARSYGGYAVSEVFRMGRERYGFVSVGTIVIGYMLCGKRPPWTAYDLKWSLSKRKPICTRAVELAWKDGLGYSVLPEGAKAVPWGYMESLRAGILEYVGYFTPERYVPCVLHGWVPSESNVRLEPDWRTA